MRFPVNLYLLSLLGAALVTGSTLPWWRAACLRFGLVDDPGHRKIHSQPTPLAGGWAIWTALALTFFGMILILSAGWLDQATAQKIAFGLGRRRNQLIAIFVGATGMLAIGALDDRHDLRPAAKFAGQAAMAALTALAGIRITLFVPSALFSYLITILWILTVTNAFNFMDNMNGLCAGLGLIATLLLGLTSALHGQYLVAGISFLTAGALFGFLPYNFPRASVFLGDSGSHLIGYLLSVLAILPHYYTRKNPHPWAVISPLLILAIPLLDLVWVVWLRWRLGQPFYIGDNNHLSHRLVRSGLTSTQSVLLIWALAAGIGSLAVLYL